MIPNKMVSFLELGEAFKRYGFHLHKSVLPFVFWFLNNASLSNDYKNADDFGRKYPWFSKKKS
jgi:hypothetical protein